MPQKQIENYFSPSNLPPKKRVREGEELKLENSTCVKKNGNVNKKRKINGTTKPPSRQTKRKAESNNESESKKQKRSRDRERMERSLDEINENFNQRNSREDKVNKANDQVSIETINVNSLIEMNRLVRMKAISKIWANDITIMVDTRIGEKKAKILNTEGNVILTTNKPFRGILMKINKRLEPELVEIDEEDANFISVIVNIGGKKIGIIGIYTPNNDDAGFFREKISKIKWQI